MIPRSPCQQQPQTAPWQELLADAITNPDELLALLNLPRSLLEPARIAAVQFKLRVPSGFVAKMSPGERDDPLLLQVLPLAEELLPADGYSTDPLAEIDAMVVPGLLHKYHGRILLTVTGACAIHCRYCFRRHYPYAEASPVRENLPRTLRYLHQHSEINEVILSGGDPLNLSDQRLSDLVKQLESVPHITRLRIHSRLPVVLPERIDDELLKWISATRLKVVLVIHANHPNEIDAALTQAMHKLHSVGVTLLNQSVLLRKVNDDAKVLTELSQRLFDAEVLPYYLHQLDSVQGAAHFAISDKTATRLIDEVRTRLPGYLVPRLVRESPHQAAKTPLL